MTARGRRSERGIAIAAALWGAALFAIIVLSVMQMVLADARNGRGRTDGAELSAVADAGVNITILALLAPKAGQPPVDGVPFMVPFAGRSIRVSVVDESGKIDLNMSSPATLRLLFLGAGVDSDAAGELAARVVAWRGTEPGGDADGAPHGALLQSVEELQLIPGVTPAIYRRVAPMVTVYSQTVGVNPAFSTLDVLAVFRTIDPNAEAAWRRMEEERAGLRAREPSPGVALGHAFTITAEVDGPASARVVRTAIVRLVGRTASPLLIYRWN